MAILLPHHLFARLRDLPLVRLGMGDLAVTADPFPVLGVRDPILPAYLFLLPLGLGSLAVGLHLLALRNPAVGLHLPAIGLLPLVAGGHLLVMLLPSW